MDELVEKLKLRNIGAKVNKTLLTVMAFANDLVLIMGEFILMKILLEDCKEFFKMKGLKVNVVKCASLRVLLIKVRHQLK